MAESVFTLRNQIVNLLNKNNTTTSSLDISDGLVSRVTLVRKGRPTYGVVNTQLPQIFVTPNTFNEEINTLGNGAFRNADFSFEIYPVVQYGIAHSSDQSGQEQAEDESIKITDNILDLVREKVDLSVTGLWVETHETNYNWEIPESTYVKASQIILTCKKLTN